MIAIENKTEEMSAEHARQVKGYEEKLREKYDGTYDEIRSVLLTTSGEAGASERDLIHFSWTRVHDIVKAVREHGRFKSEEGDTVRAFLGQYLEIVGRLTAQPETDGRYFKTLLHDHRLVLSKLLKQRDGGGADSASEVSLPDDLGTYGKTVNQLVSDFRQEPKRMRSEVKTFLKGRGFRTWTNTPAAYPTYFLYFSDESMERTRKALNVQWLLRWAIIFSHREVLMQLQFDRPKRTARPVVDRITGFMKEHPIDTSRERRNRYPLDVPWAGCFMVYKHSLMTDAELQTTPMSEIKGVTLRKLECFLEEDYSKIETYLKCMAFDPSGPT